MRKIRKAVAVSALAGAMTASTLCTTQAAANADTLPTGCVGATQGGFVCTGPATPPGTTGGLLASRSIGGVIIVIPGTAVGGTYTLGGPTGPIATGVGAPTTLCLLVTCVVEGDPIVIPGLPLPYVPVTIPSQSIPATPVSSPVSGSVSVWAPADPTVKPSGVLDTLYERCRWLDRDQLDPFCNEIGHRAHQLEELGF